MNTSEEMNEIFHLGYTVDEQDCDRDDYDEDDSQ